jgi:hypothetical protein
LQGNRTPRGLRETLKEKSPPAIRIRAPRWERLGLIGARWDNAADLQTLELIPAWRQTVPPWTTPRVDSIKRHLNTSGAGRA